MLPSRYLIGVDSDGTAFDSMNIKHEQAFIPAALEIWPMDEHTAQAFVGLEKKVNLFSSTRGVNRFPGLLMVFEELENLQCPHDGLPDLCDLRAYIAGETKYSSVTLKQWMSVHPSGELQKVLAWSQRADQLFAASCEGIQPFSGVLAALAQAGQTAEIAVVSSASKAGLQKDWTAAGLTPYVDFIMSQEDGGKTMQLQKAMANCHGGVKALMLGDTDGDAVAAHEAGAAFYPIMPGDEEASWRQFRESILPMFLADEYGAEQEAQYYARLKALLN